MPDPRLMRQQGQRSWLRAFMLWTSLPLNALGSHAPGPTYSSGTFVSFFVFTAGCKASGPPGPPLHPPWNPWNIQLSQGTGQGVSMTFNAASRLQSLEDRSAALGSRRCELPGMHSVPKSAITIPITGRPRRRTEEEDRGGGPSRRFDEEDRGGPRTRLVESSPKLFRCSD